MKIRTSVMIDKNLLSQAKQQKLKLSQLLEQKLKQELNGNSENNVRCSGSPCHAARPQPQTSPHNASIADNKNVSNYIDKEFSPRDVENFKLELQLTNITDKEIDRIVQRVKRFSDFVDFSINYKSIISYICKLKSEFGRENQRKHLLAIRRFLRYMEDPTADKLKIPPTPKQPRVVIKDQHIQKLLREADNLKFESQRLRLRAAILVGCTSGIRAQELHKLTIDDVDLDNRTIYIPASKAKTNEPRTTFISEEAKQALKKFIDSGEAKTNRLFPESTMVKQMRRLNVTIGRNTPLRLKHLRKFYSQTCDRLMMPSAVKAMLMGHSVNNSVDLGHYAYQDDGELKEIYDHYWGKMVLQAQVEVGGEEHTEPITQQI